LWRRPRPKLGCGAKEGRRRNEKVKYFLENQKKSEHRTVNLWEIMVSRNVMTKKQTTNRKHKYITCQKIISMKNVKLAHVESDEI
jgi:hypothetical protein